MKLVLTQSNVAQENLALEEMILKDKSIQEDVIMFYINKNCIIVGRNQNVWEEVNNEFVKKHNVNIVRRISGGGAVYQDVNNICFSFITSIKRSFQDFLKPVIAFLRSLGLDATFHGKNDIHVNDFKVSGNAQFRYQKKMVHHGTILFKTDLSKLANALRPNSLKLESKGIKSIRQRVSNLYDLLNDKLTTKKFLQKMVTFFQAKYNFTPLNISKSQLLEAKKLTKLRTSHAWTYGKNPEFEITNHKRFSGGTIKLLLNTSHNKITKIKFSGDFLSLDDMENVLSHFIGRDYTKQAIENTISKIKNFEDYFGQITKKELASLFF